MSRQPYRLAYLSTRLSLRKVSAILIFSLAIFHGAASSVYAGAWQFTMTAIGTPTTTVSPSRGGAAPWSAPSPQSSITTSYTAAATGGSVSPGQTVTFTAHADATFKVTAAWIPNGSLTTDPQPSVLRVTETAAPAPTASASGYDGANTVNGTASASLTGVVSGTTQYAMPGGFPGHNVTFSGKADVTVTALAGKTGSGGASTGFNYSISAAPVSATLKVDQNLQIFSPAATTPLSATISNAPGFTIDSVKIIVDGTPTTATVNPNNPANYFINWPQTGGNPSEHTVTATAQVHDSVGALTLNSLDLTNRSFATSGMGQIADDIIADVHLQSLKFNNNIGLSQDAVTLVPTPEFTWTSGSTIPATSNPAAYIQAKTVNFTMLLGSSSGAALTGSATMGYGLKLQANPNTTNPTTNVADPTLTLYDNTTGSLFVPTVCSASTTVAATTALNSWVAPYTTTFPTLTFYVEFTKLPVPVWAAVSSYGGSVGNTLYATVAAPTAPMVSPWVGVLGYACNWAKRTTTAVTATAALVSGEYNTFSYDGNVVYTDLVPSNPAQDGQEVFNLQHFLNNTAGTRYYLTGDCRTFADFLCCASGSLGALSLQVQRSSSAAMINNSPNCSFSTNYGFQAHPIANQYDENVVWHFHQWAVSSSIYDGAFQLATDQTKPNVYPTALTPLISSSLTDYNNKLVEKNVPICWNPQTAFSLTVAN